MLTGLYNAAAGMDASRYAYEVVAENLAHLAVPGYQRSEVSLESLINGNEPGLAAGRNSESPIAGTAVTDFTPGPIQHTANPLDVALVGPGFFSVSGPNGEELFTRNGTFSVGADGELLTKSGMPVLSDNGPITLPPDVAMQNLSIAADGTLTANGQTIGQLKLVAFDDQSLLKRVGTTLFRPAEGQIPSEIVPSVQQGLREMANVSPVTELVNMISAMRQYEAAQRALRAINDAVQTNTSPTG